jgi:hypothetical protein
MAEDFRLAGSIAIGVTENLTKALADECERQFENCRDTAVSFIVWLKVLRWTRIFFVVSPIIFGALATWKLLADATIPAAIFTLLATVLPPVFLAVNLEDTIKDYEKLAGEFTNLRDRFRQAKLIASQKPFPEFEAEVQALMARLEQARSRVLAPPNWSFNRARKIIKSGVYTHDHDLRETPPSSGSG